VSRVLRKYDVFSDLFISVPIRVLTTLTSVIMQVKEKARKRWPKDTEQWTGLSYRYWKYGQCINESIWIVYAAVHAAKKRHIILFVTSAANKKEDINTLVVCTSKRIPIRTVF